MLWIRILALMAALLAMEATAGCFTVSVRAQPAGADSKAMGLRPNVVKITATLGPSAVPQSGFGFIVGQQGNQLVVITADHVVRGEDPGAEDKAPLITFFENQGSQIRGKLETVRLPKDSGDLAVILVKNPGFVSLVSEAIDARPATRGLRVWLIGRAGDWNIPASPGVVAQIDSFTQRLEVEGLAARVGSSGGPLVSAEGIVGMIVMDNDLYTEATPIEPIQTQIRDRWHYPWQLVAARPPPPEPKPNPPGEAKIPTPPRPMQQSAVLCGQSVDYAVDRIGAPERYSPFLGIWTGNWNNPSRLCGALIVERVRSDGTAEIIYAYGRAGGLSHQQRRPAIIDNGGTLRFQDDQGSNFVFTIKADDVLAAGFSGASGARLGANFGKLR
jgi:Trypsin-like peptidase domain